MAAKKTKNIKTAVKNIEQMNISDIPQYSSSKVKIPDSYKNSKEDYALMNNFQKAYLSTKSKAYNTHKQICDVQEALNSGISKNGKVITPESAVKMRRQIGVLTKKRNNLNSASAKMGATLYYEQVNDAKCKKNHIPQKYGMKVYVKDRTMYEMFQYEKNNRK